MTMTTHTTQFTPAGRSRLLATATAVATLAAAGGGVGAAAASSGAHVSARTMMAAAHRMNRLESMGYVAAQCTPGGMLMVNPATHRRVTVKLG
jgi:hypothetical protein